MEPLEKRLLDLLSEELRQYREIQAIKHAEAKALLSFSARALEETNKALDSCLVKAAAAEEERREVAFQIAKPAWKKEGEPTLRDLAPLLSSEARKKVEPLARELTAVCVEIGRLQFTNTGIIERSLGYLRELIEQLLRRTQLPKIAYNSNGSFVSGKESAPGLLDRSA